MEDYPWLEKFKNAWALERLLQSPTAIAKRMFGGAAVYDKGRLLLLLMESIGEKKHRGIQYPFELWNGIFIPTEHKHHAELKQKVPGAFSHPVLAKWLYLPEDSETFEEDVRRVVFLIASGSSLVGVTPKPKQKRRTNPESRRKTKSKTRSRPKTKTRSNPKPKKK